MHGSLTLRPSGETTTTVVGLVCCTSRSVSAASSQWWRLAAARRAPYHKRRLLYSVRPHPTPLWTRFASAGRCKRMASRPSTRCKSTRRAECASIGESWHGELGVRRLVSQLTLRSVRVAGSCRALCSLPHRRIPGKPYPYPCRRQPDAPLFSRASRARSAGPICGQKTLKVNQGRKQKQKQKEMEAINPSMTEYIP